MGQAPLARIGLLFAGAAAFAEQAAAGAWTSAEGKSQSITTVSHENGDLGRRWRADAWFEYGMAGGWALNLKAETEFAGEKGYDERTGYRVGVHKSFPLGTRGAIGIQASVLGGDVLDDPLCEEGVGYEARTMIGTSWDLGGRNAFVNAEAGWKMRGGACERAFVELAAGVDITDKWRTIAKAWTEDGEGRPMAKVELGFYRDFGDYSLGLGYREEISRSFNESAVMAVLWTRL